MKISIDQAKDLSNKVLIKFGYSESDSSLATDVIIEGELVGRASHGLNRLISMKNMIADGRVTVTHEASRVIKETNNSILVDGHKKPGFMVVPYTLNLAIQKLRRDKATIICGGVTNTSPAAGMIGYYARIATENNLIYLGFHNSMSYLVPFGAKKALWGTNPVTIGAPSESGPVIWDCSSSKVSVGEVVLAKRDNKSLGEGIAVNKDGNPTTDPAEALVGGILPFAGHKGSGMAMMVELLAGALVGSSITEQKQWNWGSFFILIEPTAFRSLDEFKQAVSHSIELLKSVPLADDVNEIYYPGERSQQHRKQVIDEGEFELSDLTYKDLQKILEG